MQENESLPSVRYKVMCASDALEFGLGTLDAGEQENLEYMDDWEQVLVDTHEHTIIFYDGCEPEDRYLNRALVPLVNELNRLASE